MEKIIETEDISRPYLEECGHFDGTWSINYGKEDVFNKLLSRGI